MTGSEVELFATGYGVRKKKRRSYKTKRLRSKQRTVSRASTPFGIMANITHVARIRNYGIPPLGSKELPFTVYDLVQKVPGDLPRSFRRQKRRLLRSKKAQINQSHEKGDTKCADNFAPKSISILRMKRKSKMGGKKRSKVLAVVKTSNGACNRSVSRDVAEGSSFTEPCVLATQTMTTATPAAVFTAVTTSAAQTSTAGSSQSLRHQSDSRQMQVISTTAQSDPTVGTKSRGICPAVRNDSKKKLCTTKSADCYSIKTSKLSNKAVQVKGDVHSRRVISSGHVALETRPKKSSTIVNDKPSNKDNPRRPTTGCKKHGYVCASDSKGKVMNQGTKHTKHEKNKEKQHTKLNAEISPTLVHKTGKTKTQYKTCRQALERPSISDEEKVSQSAHDRSKFNEEPTEQTDTNGIISVHIENKSITDSIQPRTKTLTTEDAKVTDKAANESKVPDIKTAISVESGEIADNLREPLNVENRITNSVATEPFSNQEFDLSAASSDATTTCQGSVDVEGKCKHNQTRDTSGIDQETSKKKQIHHVGSVMEADNHIQDTESNLRDQYQGPCFTDGGGTAVDQPRQLTTDVEADVDVDSGTSEAVLEYVTDILHDISLDLLADDGNRKNMEDENNNEDSTHKT